MPSNKTKSRVDPRYQFDEKIWVVSLINADTTLKGKFSGHSVLLVEGKRNIPGDSVSMFNETLFIGQYDISIGPTEYDTNRLRSLKNEKGVVYKVNVRERDKYSHPRGDQYYKESTSRCWHKARENIERMIAFIKADKERTEKAFRGEAEFIKYQAYGSQGGLLQWLFSDKAEEATEEAINCAQWCLNKLKDAKITHDVKPKPETAAGGCEII